MIFVEHLKSVHLIWQWTTPRLPPFVPWVPLFQGQELRHGAHQWIAQRCDPPANLQNTNDDNQQCINHAPSADPSSNSEPVNWSGQPTERNDSINAIQSRIKSNEIGRVHFSAAEACLLAVVFSAAVNMAGQKLSCQTQCPGYVMNLDRLQLLLLPAARQYEPPPRADGHPARQLNLHPPSCIL